MRALNACATAVGMVLGGVNLAWAHPGHGSVPAESPMHYLVEPAHAVWLVLGLAVGCGIALFIRTRRLRKQPAVVTQRRRDSSAS